MKKHHQETLSDLFKLGEAAASTLLGAAQELGGTHGCRHNMLGTKADYVSRDEFDAAFAMIKKMRIAQSDLEKRLEQIESKLTLSSTVSAPETKQFPRES